MAIPPAHRPISVGAVPRMRCCVAGTRRAKKVGPLGRPRVQGGREGICRLWVIGRDRLSRVPVRSCRRGTVPRVLGNACYLTPQSACSTGSRAPSGLTDEPREGAIRRTRLARSCCTATRRPRVTPTVASQQSVRVTSALRTPHRPLPISRQLPALSTGTPGISPEPTRRYRVAAAPSELIAPSVRGLVRTPILVLYVHLPICQGAVLGIRGIGT